MTEIILAKINSKFNGYSNKIQAQTFSATGLTQHLKVIPDEKIIWCRCIYKIECPSIFHSFRCILYTVRKVIFAPWQYFGSQCNHIYESFALFILNSPHNFVFEEHNLTFQLCLVHNSSTHYKVEYRAKIKMEVKCSLQTVRPKKCSVSQAKNLQI